LWRDCWLAARQWLFSVVKFSPEQVRRMGEIKLTRASGLHTAVKRADGIAVRTGAPLSSTKLNLNESLKDGARAVSGGDAATFAERAGRVAFALALLLLTGSGLLLKSFANLRTSNSVSTRTGC